MRHVLPTLCFAALAAGSFWSVGHAAASSTSTPARAVSPSAAAQVAGVPTAGITVVGRSSYQLTAERASIRLELAETDELAGAALQKLTAAGQRLAAAVESVESGTVTLSRTGPRFGPEQADTMQMIMMGGMDEGTDDPPKVEAKEAFVLSVSAPADGVTLAALVAEVLEAAADAGAALVADQQDPQMVMVTAMMGGEQEKTERAVAFHPADDGEARSAAMEKALANARAEAELTAGLAGRSLGLVQSIRPLGDTPGSLPGAGTATREVAYEVTYAFP